jgi:hypothetical protein
VRFTGFDLTEVCPRSRRDGYAESEIAVQQWRFRRLPPCSEGSTSGTSQKSIRFSHRNTGVDHGCPILAPVAESFPAGPRREFVIDSTRDGTGRHAPPERIGSRWLSAGASQWRAGRSERLFHWLLPDICRFEHGCVCRSRSWMRSSGPGRRRLAPRCSLPTRRESPARAGHAHCSRRSSRGGLFGPINADMQARVVADCLRAFVACMSRATSSC